MKRHLPWFLIVGLIGSVQPAFANLPEEVLSFLKEQEKSIAKVGSKLNPIQRKLFLERYAGLMIDSPMTLQFEIRESELLQHLTEEIPFREAPKESSEVDHPQINTLVKVFKGKISPPNIINLHVVCSDVNYEFPFEYEKRNEGIELTLLGLGVPDDLEDTSFDHSCLKLDFSYSDTEGRIDWLGSKNAACPIPAKRAGECLLGLAEQIGKALGKTSLHLQDDSEFKCTANKKLAKLTRLRIFQEGKGWYQKNSYFPANNADTYLANLEVFRDYPLTDLAEEIIQFKPSANQKKIHKESIDLIKTYRKLKIRGHLASDFMAWLWDDNCPAYLEVDKFLFENRARFKYSSLYPESGVLKKKI